MASILDNIFGSSGSYEQSPNLNTPSQQKLVGQAQQSFSPLLERLLKPFDSSALQQGAIRRFQTEGLPSLMERLQGSGNDPRRSSYGLGQLGAAQAGLESNLAQIGSQSDLQDLMRQQGLFSLLSSIGLAPETQTTYQPGREGLLGTGIQALGQGAGAYLSSGSNPYAALLGGLGGLTGSNFGGRQQGQQQINGQLMQEFANFLQSRGQGA